MVTCQNGSQKPCISLGGHTDGRTNLSPYPLLSDSFWHSTWGCVKNLQFILMASLLLGVSIKPLYFEDNQNIHYSEATWGQNSPWLKLNPVLKPGIKRDLNKKTHTCSFISRCQCLQNPDSVNMRESVKWLPNICCSLDPSPAMPTLMQIHLKLPSIKKTLQSG